MAAKKFVFLKEEEPVLVPIWREALTPVDWLHLRTQPLYYGFGVPRGDGSAVITVPGFLGADYYLVEMNLWLNRIGYKSYRSNIGHNAECPDLLVDRLTDTIEKAHRDTGSPVSLIGHSLGGMLSRAASALRPELVQNVITLGSPFRGIRSHPTVLSTSKVVRMRIEARKHERPKHKPLQDSCFTGSCNCGFAEAMRAGVPRGIHQTAIYTKTDGIVDWHVCMTGYESIDVEVKGTHCGLAWNADVYRIVAERLELGRITTPAEEEHFGATSMAGASFL